MKKDPTIYQINAKDAIARESIVWNITDANNVILTCAMIAAGNSKISNKENLFKTLLIPRIYFSI